MNGTYLNPCQRYGADEFNDVIIDSPGNVRNKLALVQMHYGLDRLCDDPSEEVREAVRACGYVKPSNPDAPIEALTVNLDILEDYDLDFYDDDEECLTTLVRYASASLINPDDSSSPIRMRLDQELQYIIDKGLTDYFLILWDLVHEARERGIQLCPGRGASVGSLVCYLLNITEVYPIEFGLLSERFINSHTTHLCVDIEVESGRREELLHYLQQKYGKQTISSFCSTSYDPKRTNTTRFNLLESAHLSTLRELELCSEVLTYDIPLNDTSTLDLFSRGETDGVYFFENEEVRELLRRIHPDRFEELMFLNTVWRPGTTDKIDAYIRRKRGEEQVEYLLPILEEILGETKGILVYQEQMMLIAQRVAGYSADDSDLLRRLLTHPNRPELEKLHDEFVLGAINNGYPLDKVEQIWQQYLLPVRTTMNKSHMVASTMLSFYEAYYKAHG